MSQRSGRVGSCDEALLGRDTCAEALPNQGLKLSLGGQEGIGWGNVNLFLPAPLC